MALVVWHLGQLPGYSLMENQFNEVFGLLDERHGNLWSASGDDRKSMVPPDAKPTRTVPVLHDGSGWPFAPNAATVPESNGDYILDCPNFR